MAEGVLKRAGIEQADSLASVTDSDAVNAVVAHVARTVYNVPSVVSRNYDPRWRPLHEAMGLRMVSSTAWGAQRLEELLESRRTRPVFSAGNGEVEVYELDVPKTWDGKPLAELRERDRVRGRQPHARRPRRHAGAEGDARRGGPDPRGRDARGRDGAPGPSLRSGGLSMYVLIAGGGRTGATLALTLHEQKHEVRLMEHRPQVLAHLHRDLPTELVYEGNPTDPRTLELAGVQQAQVLVASMSNDAENLSLCFIARERFHVPRTIATINDPRNAWLFDKKFHVDVALNQADILASLIEQEMSLGDMMTLLKLRQGQPLPGERDAAARGARGGRRDQGPVAAAQLGDLRDPAQGRGRDPARQRAARGRRRRARARRRGLGPAARGPLRPAGGAAGLRPRGHGPTLPSHRNVESRKRIECLLISDARAASLRLGVLLREARGGVASARACVSVSRRRSGAAAAG